MRETSTRYTYATTLSVMSAFLLNLKHARTPSIWLPLSCATPIPKGAGFVLGKKYAVTS